MKMNGFVLAGGQSTRMGQDKALLRLGNTPLILRAAKILQPFVSEVILLACQNDSVSMPAKNGLR
jgi:molybdenum cofactor guanylyltransferase